MKMNSIKLKWLPVLLFLISFNIYSQSDIKSEILNGLEYYYNFRWTQAENTFQKIIDRHPDDPRGYHYKSAIYFWYYFGNKNVKDLDTFLDLSEMAIDKAVAQLDSNETNIDFYYILGANYIYRAMTFTQEGKFLDAVWATKRSESFLNKVIQLKPKYYDAYLGLGLYNFAVGLIPSGFKWALNLAGIKGDKEKGLDYIKEAVESGTFTRVEAKFYYSQILSDFFADYNSAAQLMSSLVRRYPDNLLFNYSLAVLFIKEKKLDKAEKLLRFITYQKNVKFEQLIAYSNYMIGDILFKKNNYESAIIYYNRFILSTNEKDLLGITNYRLGICYQVLGQPDVARTYFKMTDRGNQDIDEDIYAKRKGNLFAERDSLKEETDLIRIRHYIDMGKFKTALDSLAYLCDETSSDEIKAEAILNISDALFSTGKYKASIDTLKMIDSLEISEEVWIKPFASYYAARAENKLGNVNEALKYVEETEKYKNYDFQNRMKNLLFALKSEEK